MSYDLVWGGVANIEAGATTAIGATSLVFDQVNLALRRSDFDNVATRLVNVLAIELYLGAFAYGTLPHEFFGHYGHALEAGLHPTMGLDFPQFGGHTSFVATYQTPAPTREEIASAGPEVTETIAYEETKAMYSGHPIASYSLFYLLGGHLIDSYLYNLSTLQPFLKNPNQYVANNPDLIKGDPVPWALALTERYGFYNSIIPPNATWVYAPPDANVYLNRFINDQGSRVSQAFLLQLLDPVMLNGLYGLVRYVANGQPFYNPIMIGNSDFKVAPAIQANLGYVGVENYFSLFVASKWLPPFSAYFRNGGNLYHQVNGGGVEVREIPLTSTVGAAAELDGWYDGEAAKVGGNIEEKLTIRLGSNFGLYQAMGYKSFGSLLGKPTEAGLYGFIGLRIALSPPGSPVGSVSPTSVRPPQ